MAIKKGFIKDYVDNTLLPITRGELVLDSKGRIALTSEEFAADKEGNAYGLISKIDLNTLRALQVPETEGGSLTDIYNKLNSINDGIVINNIPVNFYNENSPQRFFLHFDDPLAFEKDSADEYHVTLKPLHQEESKDINPASTITIDRFGRITGVESTLIASDSIEETLSNKKLQGCTVSAMGTSDDSVVSKQYVDKLFEDNTGIVSSGALKFAGSISTRPELETVLNSPDSVNKYFIVSRDFVVDGDWVYTANNSSEDFYAKAGDTLIIYKATESVYAKVVCIPSADDLVTSIKVSDNQGNQMDFASGPVTLQFGSYFKVSNVTPNVANIGLTIPIASSTLNGLMSSDLYNKLQNCVSHDSIGYTSVYDENSDYNYKLGTLNIGQNPINIYGINYEYYLSADSKNPIIHFGKKKSDTELESESSIAFVGKAGIEVAKTQNNEIEIVSTLNGVEQIVPQGDNSRKVRYITVDEDGGIHATIGESDDNGNVIQDGLTDFSQFNDLFNVVGRVILTYTKFEEINYSLFNPSPGKDEYSYGNKALLDAITVEI